MPSRQEWPGCRTTEPGADFEAPDFRTSMTGASVDGTDGPALRRAFIVSRHRGDGRPNRLVEGRMHVAIDARRARLRMQRDQDRMSKPRSQISAGAFALSIKI